MGRVIAVANQKGGVGKSTIAVHLATTAFHAGYSACIYDADADQASCLDWAQDRADAGLAPFPVYAAGDRVQDDIDQLRRMYDFVFVDTPGSDADGHMRQGMIAADITLVPIEPATFSTKRIGRMVTYLERYPMGTARLLFSRVPPNPKRLSWHDLKDQLNKAEEIAPICPICDTVIFERVAYVDALAAGQGVCEYAPGSVAAQEMSWLFRGIEK